MSFPPGPFDPIHFWQATTFLNLLGFGIALYYWRKSLDLNADLLTDLKQLSTLAYTAISFIEREGLKESYEQYAQTEIENLEDITIE